MEKITSADIVTAILANEEIAQFLADEVYDPAATSEDLDKALILKIIEILQK